jgi:hypothetical protein
MASIQTSDDTCILSAFICVRSCAYAEMRYSSLTSVKRILNLLRMGYERDSIPEAGFSWERSVDKVLP